MSKASAGQIKKALEKDLDSFGAGTGRQSIERTLGRARKRNTGAIEHSFVTRTAELARRFIPVDAAAAMRTSIRDRFDVTAGGTSKKCCLIAGSDRQESILRN